MGGTFDWAKVKESDMRSLSERMFMPPTCRPPLVLDTTSSQTLI